MLSWSFCSRQRRLLAASAYPDMSIIRVANLKKTLFAALFVNPRLDVNGTILQNLFNFVTQDLVRGDMSLVVRVPFKLRFALHVVTLYLRCRGRKKARSNVKSDRASNLSTDQQNPKPPRQTPLIALPAQTNKTGKTAAIPAVPICSHAKPPSKSGSHRAAAHADRSRNKTYSGNSRSVWPTTYSRLSIPECPNRGTPAPSHG